MSTPNYNGFKYAVQLDIQYLGKEKLKLFHLCFAHF